MKHTLYSIAIAFLTTPVLVAAEFQNPLNDNLSTVSGFTEGLLKAVVFIVFPLAVVFVVYSGFLFVMAQGNSEGLEKAKKNFFWTIIGVALLLGAWVLASLIRGTIDQLQ